MLDCMQRARDIDACFVIVGNGTEYEMIEDYVRSGKQGNLVLIEGLPQKEYEVLMVGRVNLINSEGIRNMTPTEWGKLQGFINYAFVDESGVDHFSLPKEISDTQRYKLFGNSVSIPVIKAMAEYMIERLDDFYGNE